MKNLKFLFAFLFTFISFVISAQVPSPLIWLKMNEFNADSTVTNYGDSVVHVYAKATLPTIVNDSIKGDVMHFVQGSELTVDNTIYRGVQGDLPRTYMTWIKMDADYSGDFLIHKAGATSTTPGNPFFHIEISDSLLECYVGNANKMGTFAYYPKPYDEWHHIAYTYDNDTVYVYTDGEKTPQTLYCSGGLNTELRWVKLFQNFTGKAYDFRVYDKALSEEQIQEIVAPQTTLISELKTEDVNVYMLGDQLKIISSIDFDKVEMYKLNGTCIVSTQLKTTTLNLSNLEAGIYITVLTSEKGKRYSQKIALK